MTQAVARAAFARPARIAPRRRRPRVRAPRAGDALCDGVSTETPEAARRQMAREVTDALFQVGDSRLESRLLRLPVPRTPPPPALMALASARDPRRSLRASLHPRRLRVPDVENALCCRCELAPGERAAGCRRMRWRASNRYVADLFAIIGGDHGRVALDFTKCDASRSSRAQSRPAHRLSRFDLFHAHAFADADTLTVGLLFHASEYPAFDAKAFPHELGFCQTDSKCAYDEGKHARRNVLWVARARGTKEDLGEGRMEKKSPRRRRVRRARHDARVRERFQSAPRHSALGPRAAHDVRGGLRERRRGPAVPARAAGQEAEAPGVRVREVTTRRAFAHRFCF